MANLIGLITRTCRLWLAALLVLVFAGACDPGRPAPISPAGTSRPGATSARPVAPPDVCRQWACRPGQTLRLPGNHAVTLWLGDDRHNHHSRPVVELLEHGVAMQWWISPQGDGWNGTLTCLPTGELADPNCILIDTLGTHATVAEMVILRGGQLVHPGGAENTTNSAGMSAVDLDGDGYLDVIGSVHDAQGVNYWLTFGWDGRLVVTGCAPKPGGAPTPTQLLRGFCPTQQ